MTWTVSGTRAQTTFVSLSNVSVWLALFTKPFGLFWVIKHDNGWQVGTVVPPRFICRILPVGPRDSSGKKETDWDHRYRPTLATSHRDLTWTHTPCQCRWPSQDGTVVPPLLLRRIPTSAPKHRDFTWTHTRYQCRWPLVWEERDGLGPSVSAHISDETSGFDMKPHSIPDQEDSSSFF
jgi:hypothetical protein